MSLPDKVATTALNASAFSELTSRRTSDAYLLLLARRSGTGAPLARACHAHSPRACSAFDRRAGIADLRARSLRAQGGRTRARLPQAAQPRQEASVAATRRLAAGPTFVYVRL